MTILPRQHYRPLLACLGLTMLTTTVSACASETESVHADCAEMTAALETLHEEGDFNGTALFARGDQIIYRTAVGFENAAEDIPLTPDTRFRIASLTKQFTAAIILKLYEDDRIDLDATIADYLPDFTGRPAQNVTIRQLLGHTSGIANDWPTPDPVDTRNNPEAFLMAFRDLPLEFEPGKRFSYSNSNYYVLGVIIETVTGRPYGDAMDQYLLVPLGLEDTGTIAQGETVPRLALGYIRDGEDYIVSDPYEDGHPYAAGMMYSTIEDLAAWQAALYRGRVFRSDRTLDIMTTPRIDAYDAEGFGTAQSAYGLFRVRNADTGREWIHHDGRHETFLADMRYYPVEKLITVTLESADGDLGKATSIVERAAFGTLGQGSVSSSAGP